MPSEFGKAARMFTARTFFGIEQRDMAALLKVRLSTYQRWENGRDPIPAGIWSDVDALFERFDDEVAQMVTAAEDAPEVVRVRVWRSRNEHHPFPGWWARVVGEALRRTEKLEPVFPEDDKDEA
jgi:transcriptional regulator with XRE-family HTH domain